MLSPLLQIVLVCKGEMSLCAKQDVRGLGSLDLTNIVSFQWTDALLDNPRIECMYRAGVFPLLSAVLKAALLCVDVQALSFIMLTHVLAV